MNQWIKTVASLFPPTVVGFTEYHLYPHLVDIYGGAFNGQCFRQLIFMDLLHSCRFEAIIETGTFRGATTSFMARNSGIPVFTSELNKRFVFAASKRLRGLNNVLLFNEDSRKFLRRNEINKELRTFFYLDAHWQEDLPLREETEYIFSQFKRFVVMIDDFEVPGDRGYSFDDYGPTKKLSLSDFPFERDRRVRTYFPNRPSGTESGLKRGCVVLASADLVPQADTVPGLSRVEQV